MITASPFPPGGKITLLLPDGGLRRGIRFFDLQGKLLGEHFAERKAPGRYELSWDGRDASGKLLPSGLYFLRPEGSPALFRLILLR